MSRCSVIKKRRMTALWIGIQLLKRIKEQMAASYRASWGKTLGTDAKSFHGPTPKD